MVELKFFAPKDHSELDYKLDEIQSQFSALPKQALEKKLNPETRMKIFSLILLLFFMMKKLQVFVS
ncbi:hypothetical protein [Chryseobacterium sp. CBo1]|uniref:hypothetical protein n=1 Tax=Chryseobacterium sp. CBo1 TaxID=1869230 RepID=UPI001E64C3AB|nr:hypothetical protein [Chryseobacterium sp. CBo1]